MHIAIDDTYGPEITTASDYVTGSRRTHVAVVFGDDDVDFYRSQIKGILSFINEKFDFAPNELHFVDIYNRNDPWDQLPDEANLRIFKAFFHLYKIYKWPIHIQTIDQRTLSDHGVDKFEGTIQGLKLSNRSDLSLVWLLIKLKKLYWDSTEDITAIIDEGAGKSGQEIGSAIFHDWPREFSGSYASSAEEPLLQLADFVAFCINRSTHLGLKEKRTDVDNWFLQEFGLAKFNCPDLNFKTLPPTFGADDVDEMHEKDRRGKGLSLSNK